MIDFLPSSPGNACVSLKAWMISSALRAYRPSCVERPCSMTSDGRSRAADQLLCDRGGAAAVAAAPELRRERVDRGFQVEARVLPERVVLDGGRDVEDELGDLLELEDLAALLPEARQPRLPGPVVHRRRLREAEVAERADVGKPLLQRGDRHADRAARGDHGRGGDRHQRHDQDQRDGDEGAGSSARRLSLRETRDSDAGRVRRGLGVAQRVGRSLPGASVGAIGHAGR